MAVGICGGLKFFLEVWHGTCIREMRRPGPLGLTGKPNGPGRPWQLNYIPPEAGCLHLVARLPD